MTRSRALIATAALAALTSCGHANKPAATPASTTKASTADIAYLAAVRPHLQGSSDNDVISLGRAACDSLKDKSVLDVASDLAGQGFSSDAAAAITTGAIQTYCPQYTDKIGQ